MSPEGLGEGSGVGGKRAAPPESTAPALHMVLEPMPKWRLIEEIVKEIDDDKEKLLRKMEKYGADDEALVDELTDDDKSIASFLKSSKDIRKAEGEGGPSLAERYGQGPTLIVAKDEAAASQLTGMLLRGSEGLMRQIWEKYLRQRKAAGDAAKGKEKPTSASSSGRGGGEGGRGGGRGPRPMSKMDRMGGDDGGGCSREPSGAHPPRRQGRRGSRGPGAPVAAVAAGAAAGGT